MKKGLFEYCQKHLGTGHQFKVSASFKQLVERYNIGYIVDKIYYFSEKDRQSLLELVAMEHDGIHLFRDPYPDLQTRTQTVKMQRNEKVGAVKVSEDFILLNCFDHLCLNQQVTAMSPLTSLGHYICASEIETIEHQ